VLADRPPKDYTKDPKAWEIMFGAQQYQRH
jgi:hypothetical protein